MKFRSFVGVASALLSLALLSEVFCNLREVNQLMKLLVASGHEGDLVGTATRIARMATSVERPAPLFILHCGPGKTGTTTIQWAAAQHEEMLRKNNIYFMGTHWSRPEWNLHDFFRTCYDVENSKECKERWAEFEERVEYHFSQGHNVFVSEEMITGFRSTEVEQEHLWKHLDPLLSKWQVRIVFTYRRFHEWIPSKYHQAFSPQGPIHNRAKREEWPSNGGRSIPEFQKYLDYLLRMESFTFPHAIHKRWSSHFDNVQVFNMHQEGDLVENFFCQVVPEAPLLCKHLGLEDFSSASSKPQLNPSSLKVLHYDMIAVRAHQKGWITNKEVTRKQATKAAAWFSQTKLDSTQMTDFPLKCLTENQTALLLETSMEFEHELVADYMAFTNGTQDELTSRFERDLESGKFCSINLEETFKDKQWQRFFQKLNPSNNTAVESRGGSEKKRGRRKRNHRESTLKARPKR